MIDRHELNHIMVIYKPQNVKQIHGLINGKNSTEFSTTLDLLN